MKFIKKLWTVVFTAWVLIVFTTFMLILLPFILIPVLISDKLGNITYFFLKVWSWVFSKLTFIRYDISGRENVNWNHSYIFVSNHTSFLDIPGLCLAINSQFRPLAKKDLKKIPVFGWIVAAATIMVDRSNPESRKESLLMLRKKLDAGISILVFPEGTQNRTANLLQPFYEGAFRTAINTSHDVLPMVIVNAGKLMPPGKMRIAPGKIKVIFSKPISVASFSSSAELKSETYHHMYQMLSEEIIPIQ